MTQFEQFPLPGSLLLSLKNMKFDTPTPIQEAAIPLALAGKDILGSAQTGTGKTGAFGIPLVAHLLNNPQDIAVVLTPTRELASQVIKVVQQLLDENRMVKTALLIGGDSMQKQLQQLRQRPRVIVGTPGRINDHLTRRTLDLKNATMLVLDETDRMLDMGFGVQIEKIIKMMPQDNRQTMMFSATLPPEIVKLSNRYLRNPERISMGDTHLPAQDIVQELVHTTDGAKYDVLIEQLNKREGSIVVFVKTKYGAEKLAKRLSRENHSAEAIHGDLRQNKREKVIREFRSRVHRILVATDVASRGLDIPHIEHVINFDLPQCPEDYIHRIGRTARAGAKGASVSLLAPADSKKWRAIHEMLNPGESRRPQRAEGAPLARRDRTRSERPQKARSFDNDRPRSDAPRGDRPYGDKPRFDKPRSDRPAGDRPYGDKPRGDRPYSDKPRFDKPRSDRPAGDRPYGDKPRGDRPYGDKPRFDKPRSDRPAGDRPYGDKPRSDKPRGDRPFGDKPRGDRPAGDHPARSGGDKPFRSGPKKSGGQNSGSRFQRRAA